MSCEGEGQAPGQQGQWAGSCPPPAAQHGGQHQGNEFSFFLKVQLTQQEMNRF